MKNRRHILRAGPLAWTITGFWLLMLALAVATVEPRPWVFLAALIGAVSLVARTFAIGVHVHGERITVVDWIRVRTRPLDLVTGVRDVHYDGFARDGADSHYLSMIEVGIDHAHPLRIRGLIARARTSRTQAALLARFLGVYGPSGSGVDA
jgi:hypothetical protein